MLPVPAKVIDILLLKELVSHVVDGSEVTENQILHLFLALISSRDERPKAKSILPQSGSTSNIDLRWTD